MSTKLFKSCLTVVIVAAVCGWSMGALSASARAQGCCGGQGRGGKPNHAQADRHEPAPHDGQLSVIKPLVFEVVYLPREIRVYIYSPYPKPQTAKGVEGQVALQPLRDKKHVTRLPLRYVAPAGEHEQDYLSAAIDLRGVKDKTLAATIKLEKLPKAKPPEVEFT